MGGGVEVILSGGSGFAFGDTWARGWFGVFLGSPWGFLEAGLGSRDAPRGGMWQNGRETNGAVSCFEARYPFLVLQPRESKTNDFGGSAQLERQRICSRERKRLAYEEKNARGCAFFGKESASSEDGSNRSPRLRLAVARQNHGFACLKILVRGRNASLNYPLSLPWGFIPNPPRPKDS